ncbi:universal stress protein [uncultured Tateyamaria sp.]|uniref:universal stress protein n=1 Tax=uncultured Tateyamaria sp. TaxID=455651 RepID=UPI002635F171|nr:universal stress protein [uncultured Tateyamaria sp.]
MEPKTILVCLTTEEHAATLMKVAVPLARRTGAHLIGLHTLEALEVYPGIAIHVPDNAFKFFNDSQKAKASEIKKIFDAHTHAEGFVSEFRLVQAQSNTASERMIESARAADLVIMAHEDKEVDRYDQRRVQAEVVRQSGRPVIVVPLNYDGPEIGNKVLLGWSDTREAARAAHDMLGVTVPDAEIVVLRVKGRDMDEMQDADMLDLTSALSRHGRKVELRHLNQAGQAIAEVLMECAFEQGADLVVTGAFGHSNAYDFVVGATSKALLRNARLPVLLCK